MSVLLELGGDINKKAFTGETPLHVAVIEEIPLQAIFDKLPYSEIDLEMTDHYGSTPAHWALTRRNVRLFELIPEPGVPRAMIDCKGRDLFDLWISLHNDAILTKDSNAQSPVTKFNTDHDYCRPYNEPQSSSKEKEDPTSSEYLKLEGNNQATYDLTLRNNIPVDQEGHCGERMSILGECPILKWLFEEEDTLTKVKIPLNKWSTHLEQHKENVSGYISMILESPDMGLYFNLAENRHIEEAVHTAMKEMANRLAAACPLMASEIELRGSRCEGTKVGYLDEFDYIFYLTEFETVVVPEESNEHGYVRLRIIQEEDDVKFKDFVNEDDYVDALKVVPKIFKSFNSVVEDIDFMKRANLYPLRLLNPHKYSIDNFEFLWTGPTYKRLKISVDIVPAIRLSTWVSNCVNTLPKLLGEFHIKPQVSAVFKTKDSTLTKACSTYFRVSVAAIESGVLKALPSDVRKGFIIIKALKDSTYFPRVGCIDDSQTEEFITTYMIKCAFLHEVESNIAELRTDLANPREEAKINTPIKWAKRTIERMKRSFEQKSLTAFYMNGIDFVADGLFTDADDALRIGKVEIQCLDMLLDCFDDDMRLI